MGCPRWLLLNITMVCAARLSQILVKRGTNGVLTLKAPGAALFYTAGPCGRRRMSSQSQSSRGDRVGPDRILPANSLSTTWPDGAVEIRFSDKHPLCQEKPISVWTMLNNTVKRNPNGLAMAVKRNDEWVKWTYAEYLEDVKTVAKAFIKLGLKPYHSVNIMGFNAPEWHISAVAGVVAGGLTAGIYTTNSEDATRYVAEHSRCNVMVVEDEEQLNKVENIQDMLPELQAIIQYTGFPRSPEVLSWESLLEIGRGETEDELHRRLAGQATNQACTLVYTSGTFIDIYLIMYGGGAVYFADKMALQGTLLKTLVEAKPTLFFGVPRVYEKIQEKMKEAAKANTGLKKTLSDMAKEAALEHHFATFEGKPGGGLKYKLGKKVGMSKGAKALGFERTRGFYSSAAPLSEDVFRYFCSLDMPIQELLGSSETSGPQTASTPGPGIRLGSVGKPYPAWDVHVLNPDETGLGEIATRGRNACMGYLWEEGKTAELHDAEGYVLSGDLGRFDSDGFLYLTGRQKEIIVTAGGENIAPVPIEDAIKEVLKDYIANCLVIGDKRKHLACILTLRTVLDDKNQPTDVLHPDVKEWADGLGLEADTVEEFIAEDNPEVKSEIMTGIKKVNKRAVSNAAKVHKFMIAPQDFSLATGELTPTMKVKRHFVLEKYKRKIDQMYEHETQSSMW